MEFDETLKSILQDVLNVQLNGAQWCQASLPVRFGGLGVRRLQEVGPTAFLASSHGVAELVAQILPNHGDGLLLPFVREALEAWYVLCPNAERPLNPERQREWDDITSKKLSGGLLERSSGVDEARLRAMTVPESGLWLHALPSPNMGTLLDDDTVRNAVALRLGCDVCEPHICVCGAVVDANGHHGLSCSRCAGRIPRHQAVNEIIRRAMISAGVPCVLEPPGLSRSDGKRPDGLTLIPWQRGRCLVWDATCVNTYRFTYCFV